MITKYIAQAKSVDLTQHNQPKPLAKAKPGKWSIIIIIHRLWPKPTNAAPSNANYCHLANNWQITVEARLELFITLFGRLRSQQHTRRCYAGMGVTRVLGGC